MTPSVDPSLAARTSREAHIALRTSKTPSRDLSRLYAIGRCDGRPAAFLVDTASPDSFVIVPGDRAVDHRRRARVELGGTVQKLPARNDVRIDERTDNGIRVVGFIGNDFFREGSGITVIDPTNRIMYRAKKFIAGERWSPMPFEWQNNYMFVRAKVDGKPLRLAFDTGAPDTFLLGEMGRPGDVACQSVDGYGTPVTFYRGDSLVELPGQAPVCVPVLRAPQFKSMEDSNRQQGHLSNGLIGLSTLGERRVVIHATTSTIWIERRPVQRRRTANKVRGQRPRDGT
jgi:hypothetical protein